MMHGRKLTDGSGDVVIMASPARQQPQQSQPPPQQQIKAATADNGVSVRDVTHRRDADADAEADVDTDTADDDGDDDDSAEQNIVDVVQPAAAGGDDESEAGEFEAADDTESAGSGAAEADAPTLQQLAAAESTDPSAPVGTDTGAGGGDPRPSDIARIVKELETDRAAVAGLRQLTTQMAQSLQSSLAFLHSLRAVGGGATVGPPPAVAGADPSAVPITATELLARMLSQQQTLQQIQRAGGAGAAGENGSDNGGDTEETDDVAPAPAPTAAAAAAANPPRVVRATPADAPVLSASSTPATRSAASSAAGSVNVSPARVKVQPSTVVRSTAVSTVPASGPRHVIAFPASPSVSSAASNSTAPPSPLRSRPYVSIPVHDRRPVSEGGALSVAVPAGSSTADAIAVGLLGSPTFRPQLPQQHSRVNANAAPTAERSSIRTATTPALPDFNHYLRTGSTNHSIAARQAAAPHPFAARTRTPDPAYLSALRRAEADEEDSRQLTAAAASDASSRHRRTRTEPRVMRTTAVATLPSSNMTPPRRLIDSFDAEIARHRLRSPAAAAAPASTSPTRGGLSRQTYAEELQTPFGSQHISPRKSSLDSNHSAATDRTDDTGTATATATDTGTEPYSPAGSGRGVNRRGMSRSRSAVLHALSTAIDSGAGGGSGGGASGGDDNVSDAGTERAQRDCHLLQELYAVLSLPGGGDLIPVLTSLFTHLRLSAPAMNVLNRLSAVISSLPSAVIAAAAEADGFDRVSAFASGNGNSHAASGASVGSSASRRSARSSEARSPPRPHSVIDHRKPQPERSLQPAASQTGFMNRTAPAALIPSPAAAAAPAPYFIDSLASPHSPNRPDRSDRPRTTGKKKPRATPYAAAATASASAHSQLRSASSSTASSVAAAAERATAVAAQFEELAAARHHSEVVDDSDADYAETVASASTRASTRDSSRHGSPATIHSSKRINKPPRSQSQRAVEPAFQFTDLRAIGSTAASVDGGDGGESTGSMSIVDNVGPAIGDDAARNGTGTGTGSAHSSPRLQPSIGGSSLRSSRLSSPNGVGSPPRSLRSSAASSVQPSPARPAGRTATAAPAAAASAASSGAALRSKQLFAAAAAADTRGGDDSDDDVVVVTDTRLPAALPVLRSVASQPATPAGLSRQGTTDSQIAPPMTPHDSLADEQRLAARVNRAVLERQTESSPAVVARKVAELAAASAPPLAGAGAAAAAAKAGAKTGDDDVVVDTPMQQILKPLLDACLLPAEVCVRPTPVLSAVRTRLNTLFRSAHLALRAAPAAAAAASAAAAGLPTAADMKDKTIAIVAECIGRRSPAGVDFHLREALTAAVNALFPVLSAAATSAVADAPSVGEPPVGPSIAAAVDRVLDAAIHPLLAGELQLSSHIRRCMEDCARNQQQLMASVAALPGGADVPAPTAAASQSNRKHASPAAAAAATASAAGAGTVPRSSGGAAATTAAAEAMRRMIVSQCNQLENHKLLYVSSQLNARTERLREFRKTISRALALSASPLPAAAAAAPAAAVGAAAATTAAGTVDADGFAVHVLRDGTADEPDAGGSGGDDDTESGAGAGTGDEDDTDHTPSLGADYAVAPVTDARPEPKRTAAPAPAPAAVRNGNEVDGAGAASLFRSNRAVSGDGRSDDESDGGGDAEFSRDDYDAVAVPPPSAGPAKRTGEMDAADFERYRAVERHAAQIDRVTHSIERLDEPPRQQSLQQRNGRAAKASAADDDSSVIVSADDLQANAWSPTAKVTAKPATAAAAAAAAGSAKRPPAQPVAARGSGSGSGGGSDLASAQRSLQLLIAKNSKSVTAAPSAAVPAAAVATANRQRDKAVTAAAVSSAPYAIPHELAVPAAAHLPGLRVSPASRAALASALAAEQNRFAAVYDPLAPVDPTAHTDAGYVIPPASSGDVLDPDQFQN